MKMVKSSPKVKEFADDNFKFDQNSGKFSKRVENTVGNGEIFSLMSWEMGLFGKGKKVIQITEIV